MIFYTGIDRTSLGKHFERVFVSVNTIRNRKSDFEVGRWIMDSGGFTELTKHGGYRDNTNDYVKRVTRWSRCGRFEAALCQDWPCAPPVLEATGFDIEEHQYRTALSYFRLGERVDAAPIMPVLQGWAPADYQRHLEIYDQVCGGELPLRAWVAVGSLAGRQRSARVVEEVLFAIRQVRPDLRLHGLGLKRSALSSDLVKRWIYSADSMQWCWWAFMNGLDNHSPESARRWLEGLDTSERQMGLEGL